MTQETRFEKRAATEEWHGERGTKRLKCATDATAFQKEYYRQVKERVAQGEPVIWVYTGSPFLLFRSMDILMQDSVNYSAVISAKQMSRYYLDRLNTEGYFRDLCRYCTVPLGYAFDRKPEVAPWGGLPKFAAAIGYHQDDPCMKIWEVYHREFNVPLYFVDQTYTTRLPQMEHWWENCYGPDTDIEPHRVELEREEYEGLIRFLETVTGKHCSMTNLSKSIERYNQECEYYWMAADLEGTIPCPITWVDELSSIAISNYFPGTEVGLNHARNYYTQIKERVDKKQYAVPDEKVRLYWNGHPPWFSLGFFGHWEERYGAVFLPMRYLAGREIGIRRDVSDPLHALASRISMRLNGMPTWKTSRIIYQTKRYHAHGVVFMVVESCKLLYTGILFARQSLEKEGIPTLEINADMVDARDWDDTKMKALVTGFIETLMP